MKARWQALIGLAGPAVLATLLPAPGALLAQVSRGPDAIEVLGAAMMLAVTALVWGLLAWAVLVGGATLLTRAPGVAGRVGRAVLRVTAPAAARRILIVATGVSLVAGASACGTAAAASAAHGSSGSGVAVTAVTASSAVTGGSAVRTVPGATASAGAAPGSGTSSGPAYSGGYAGPGRGSGATSGDPSRESSRTAAGDPTGSGPRINLDWPMSDAVAGDRAPSAATDPAGTPGAGPVSTAPDSTGSAGTVTTSGDAPSSTSAAPATTSGPVTRSGPVTTSAPITSPAPVTSSTPAPGKASATSTPVSGHPLTTTVPAPADVRSSGPGPHRSGGGAHQAASHPAGSTQGATHATGHPTAGPGSGAHASTAPTSTQRPSPRPSHPISANGTTAGHEPASRHPSPTAHSAGTGAAPSPDIVTVRPGDSLWTIAARHLPAGATDAQIDAAWRTWYAANEAVIGANPNLILPGQHLTAPDTEGASS